MNPPILDAATPTAYEHGMSAPSPSPSPATDVVQRVPREAVRAAIEQQRAHENEPVGSRKRRTWRWLAAFAVLAVSGGIAGLVVAGFPPPSASSLPTGTAESGSAPPPSATVPAPAAAPAAQAASIPASSIERMLQIVPRVGERGLTQGWQWAVSGHLEAPRFHASTPVRSAQGDSGLRLAASFDPAGGWRIALVRRASSTEATAWPNPGSTVRLRLRPGDNEYRIAAAEEMVERLILGDHRLLAELLAAEEAVLHWRVEDGEWMARAATAGLQRLIRLARTPMPSEPAL